MPGVLGDMRAVIEDSHASGCSVPHYTRPAEFRGLGVPPILLSATTRGWRAGAASGPAAPWRRPDLLEGADLSDADRRFLARLRAERSE